ncbi:MAG: CarD family transcriptional regulator, partial [bacterium]
INKILSGENCAIKKLAGSLKSLICALILAETERPLLIVLPEEEEAEVLWEHLSPITDKNIGLYPGGEEEPDTPLILNPRRAGRQAALLRDAVRNEVDAVITTAEGIGYRLPDPAWFNKYFIELSRGSSFDLHQLIETLLEYGYTRESMVERPGEISLRGGILDVFPFTGESPYRIEFFGNEIDSMRLIDIETQRSQEIQKVLTLAPTSIFWQKRHSSLLSYFDNPLLFLQDQDLILGKINHTFHVRESYFIQAQEIAAQFRQYQILEYHTLQAPTDCLDMGAEPWIRSGTKVQDIKDQLYGMTQSYKDIYIVCEDSYQRERIQDYLDITREAYPNIHCIIDCIHQGFLIPRSKIAVISAHQIWGRKRVKRRKKGFETGVPIRELSALKPGDYVVHIDHGIGVYQGLDKITVRDSTRECLKIVYKDGDRLYVSVDKMQRVQKYSGREGAEPVINKLGSDTWERTKQKTKESIMRITQDLIKLYSQRHTMSGYTFSRDTVWQQELDDSFEYEETLDQKK